MPFPPPGDLSDPEIEAASLVSPALAGDSLPLCYLGNHAYLGIGLVLIFGTSEHLLVVFSLGLPCKCLFCPLAHDRMNAGLMTVVFFSFIFHNTRGRSTGKVRKSKH